MVDGSNVAVGYDVGSGMFVRTTRAVTVGGGLRNCYSESETDAELSAKCGIESNLE